jgi:hypothetical protein
LGDVLSGAQPSRLFLHVQPKLLSKQMRLWQSEPRQICFEEAI